MTWKEMDKIDNSTSRYCNECSVDLVDFTSMSDDEMVAYLSTRKTEKVCVRMYAADALANPSRSQKFFLNGYKKIKSSQINRHLKAAILVVFSSVLLTACGGGEDVRPPCRTELVPDTTTVEPIDSVEVVLCD
jgi:hypothetical protein